MIAVGSFALALTLVAAALGAQEGPIRLFPEELSPPAPAPGPGQRPPGIAPDPEAGGSIAAPPPRGFQIEGLAPPEADSIGISDSEGGFPRNLWAGSNPELILSLLATLPVPTGNPPLAELTRRVLATGAPLDGATEGGRALSARVERLLAMGDLDSAKQLLDQLPPAPGDSALARMAADAALLAGDDAAACQRAADLAPASDAEFWAEIVVYCRLAAGDQAGARLALDLLREAGQTEDAAFFQLASMVADGRAETAPPPLSSPQPVHIALLRLAGQPLPAPAVAALAPAALTAVARDPGLAGDRQLEIAERAFRSGGLPARDLAAIYAERAPEGDARAALRTAWDPSARAMVFDAAGEEQPPPELATLLDASWRAARGDERFLIAETLGGRFAALPVDRALLPVAPSVARALLGGGRSLPAAHWFALLEDARGSDSRVERELAALTPLFALAGIGASEAVPELDRAAVAAWRAATPNADAGAERLFALLGGVGAPVPDWAWWQELEPPLQRSASVPVTPLWRGLERAVAGQRRGEALLFALHMLDGQPDAVHGEALIAALRALRAIGLDREARAIAVATALALDL